MEGPIRKLMRRWEQPGVARFITASCDDRRPYFSEPGVPELFVDALGRARANFLFALYAWVIMPEHFHILALPPEGVTMSRILVFIKTSVAQRALRSKWPVSDDPARFWLRGGGFDRNVRDHAAFCGNVHYIHNNPVERGLVERPEDWRWSSVRWWMGRRNGELTCDAPPGDPRSWSNWRGFM